MGDPASAADWAPLAIAGATGAVGATGSVGPVGPIGMTGLTGASGPTGPTGVAGQAGAVGPMGPAGAVGAPGVAGPSGPAGPLGITGATGPAGPAGPIGPQGTPGVVISGTSVTPALASPILGTNVYVLGDSYCSDLGDIWQSEVIRRTGVSILQDCFSGRRIEQAFTCYGAAAPGMPLSTWNNNYPGVFPYWCPTGLAPAIGVTWGPPTGTTLAQNLATVQELVLALGSNSENDTVGTITDGPDANTYYGAMNWTIQTLIAANPQMRIILVTPNYRSPTYVDDSKTQAIVNADIAIARLYSLTLVNMYADSQINVLNYGTVLQSNGNHPTIPTLIHNYAPPIARALSNGY